MNDAAKSLDEFEYEMRVSGFSIFEDIVPVELIERIRIDLPKRQEVCRYWQLKNGITSGMEGAAHHMVGGVDSLAEFLEQLYLDEFIRKHFAGEYILNSFGALINLPISGDSYKHGHSYHRDVRTFSDGFRLLLNMLVMIDEFTIENGATKVVPGSHRVKERPSDDYLESHAVQLTGRPGAILLFDSNLWHSAAPNITTRARMALTPTFSRPFFKQQLDYPRLLGDAYPKNEKMRQLYGFNARVPANYDEWYQPAERRMYKQGQG
jgi:ectoine hydroxylase-related dioxygenase (phytanoyl-CoA dioxygenase family)